MTVLKKISSTFYYLQWLFQTRKLRKNVARFKVLSILDTISKISEKKLSVSRFGDGEFRLLREGHYLEFQENSASIREKLNMVLESELNNHIVCIPEPFCSVKNLTIPTKYWWKKFLNTYGAELTEKLDINKTYGNAFITRFYIGYEDKSKKTILVIIKKLQTIWEHKEILIIEGAYSRLGVGNDLFSNAASVKRIICPEKNAFSNYDEILKQCIEHGNNKVVLIALGPTASILALELAQINYWAIDVGHIDIEYMWFLERATSKKSIVGRHVNEAKDQELLEIPEAYKDYYEKSILLKIE